MQASGAATRAAAWTHHTPLVLHHHHRRAQSSSSASRQMQLAATRVPSVEAAVLVDAGTPYLDVRTPEEYAEGHAVGAVNIPLLLKNAASGQLEPNPDFVPAVRAAFPDAAEQFIVGCRSGMRSARACAVLEEQQFSNLIDDAGGWLGWVDAQLPAEK